MLPAVNVLAVALSCALVAVLALRIPAARRDPAPRLRLWPGGPVPRLDLLCLPGAVAGLLLLLVIRNPAPAVAVTVATDALAFPPTYGHIWAEPHREPWLTYALYSAGGAVSLLAADWGTPAGWVYPVYLCAGDGIAALLVIARRRAVAGPAPQPAMTPAPAAGDTLIRPYSAPLPPDDGLQWFERPEWYAALRASGRLPSLELADPEQDQSAWQCTAHRLGCCRECARYPRPWLRGDPSAALAVQDGGDQPVPVHRAHLEAVIAVLALVDRDEAGAVHAAEMMDS
jgi:hypothetical protein